MCTLNYVFALLYKYFFFYQREELRFSVRVYGHFKDWTGHYEYFELKDNLTDSTILNTVKTGVIYNKVAIFSRPQARFKPGSLEHK